MKNLSKLSFYYTILKATNGPAGGPLPNMDQYYLTKQDKRLSFWNDIDINFNQGTVNACIEIPKQISNKLQVKKKIPFHPIMQDTKNNIFNKQLELRYYAQFPFFNYGFIPQTWEQNIRPDSQGRVGDDDPIDICDLSERKMEVGSIYKAKILGCFCLIDQGEIDWKVLLIDSEQAKRRKITSMSDFSKERVSAILQWFKTIKVFDGKKANTIEYNDKIFTIDETLEIIHETNKEWKALMSDKSPVYHQIRRKFHIAQPK